MRVRSLRGRVTSRSLTLGAVLALMLAGPGCSSDSSPPPCAPAIAVRTASGSTMDVCGTSWTACILNDVQWNRTTMSFAAGTFTVVDVTYATTGCTGTPVSTGTPTVAPIVTTGDHAAGWGEEGPPPGLATTVTATGVVITWPQTSDHPGDIKGLLFVDDGAAPEALHFGGKTPGADGYPTTLERTARTRVP